FEFRKRWTRATARLPPHMESVWTAFPVIKAGSATASHSNALQGSRRAKGGAAGIIHVFLAALRRACKDYGAVSSPLRPDVRENRHGEVLFPQAAACPGRVGSPSS